MDYCKYEFLWGQESFTEETSKNFKSGLVGLVLALWIVAFLGHLLCMLPWPSPFLGSMRSLSFQTVFMCGCPSSKAWPTSFLILLFSSFIILYAFKNVSFFLLPSSFWIAMASLVLREYHALEGIWILKSDKLEVEPCRCHLVSQRHQKEFAYVLAFFFPSVKMEWLVPTS